MESTKVKRATVAERFRKQMDHLTRDEKATEGSEAKRSISELSLRPPLIPLPPRPSEKLTKSQIMSLYDLDFVFVRRDDFFKVVK